MRTYLQPLHRSDHTEATLTAENPTMRDPRLQYTDEGVPVLPDYDGALSMRLLSGTLFAFFREMWRMFRFLGIVCIL